MNALANKYGVIGTPSGVIIENGKATLYGGQENFKNNYLATQYHNAITRDNASTVRTTKQGANVIANKTEVVDPPPAKNNKTILIAAGILIALLILK